MVLRMSKHDCANKLGHRIHDSLLCVVLPAYGGKISEKFRTVRMS